MRGPGLLGMIEIAAGLSIAGPMFIVGVEFARSGQFLLGTAMVGLGLVAMFFPSYLLRRIGGWFRRPLGGSDDDRSGHSSPLDRFRDE